MKKCGKVKNPCKICQQTVNTKNGLRCLGVCKKWAHFKCLNYSPGKIKEIKAGVLKINCPCPDCNVQPKEIYKNEAYSCGKRHCPANKHTCDIPSCPKNLPDMSTQTHRPVMYDCPADCPSFASLKKKSSIECTKIKSSVSSRCQSMERLLRPIKSELKDQHFEECSSPKKCIPSQNQQQSARHGLPEPGSMPPCLTPQSPSKSRLTPGSIQQSSQPCSAQQSLLNPISGSRCIKVGLPRPCSAPQGLYSPPIPQGQRQSPPYLASQGLPPCQTSQGSPPCLEPQGSPIPLRRPCSSESCPPKDLKSCPKSKAPSPTVSLHRRPSREGINIRRLPRQGPPIPKLLPQQLPQSSLRPKQHCTSQACKLRTIETPLCCKKLNRKTSNTMSSCYAKSRSYDNISKNSEMSRDRLFSKSISDSDMISSPSEARRLLMCAADQITCTIGQFSKQFKELMCRMMAALETC